MWRRLALMTLIAYLIYRLLAREPAHIPANTNANGTNRVDVLPASPSVAWENLPEDIRRQYEEDRNGQ